MAFRAFSSSSKGWGDCDSGDELEVPRRALAFARKATPAAVAATCSRPVRADDLRQLADDSQDGINLAFKQTLTIAGDEDDAAAPSMASALQAAMSRRPREQAAAAAPTRSRKRTAAGRPVGEASPQKPLSPLPAWSARVSSGQSFAAALAGAGAGTAAAVAPSTPLSAAASAGDAATPQTARSSPPSLARALSYASAASRDALPQQSLGKRMKRALLDDAGDTDAPRARSASDAAARAEDGAPSQGAVGSSSVASGGESAGPEAAASETGSAPRGTERPAPEPLTEDRVSKRSRQIDLGKATTGYRRYAEAVPREARIPGSEFHPTTPNARAGESKRQWMGRARQWRRQLHLWDEGVPDGAPDLRLPAPALGSAASAGTAGRRRARGPKRAAPNAGRRSSAAAPSRADEA